MTSPSDKADQEILFNALLAAKLNVESALREARLLVGMPEPTSTTEAIVKRAQEAVLRRVLEWASHEGRAHCYDDLIDYCTQNGIALDTFCKDARP